MVCLFGVVLFLIIKASLLSFMQYYFSLASSLVEDCLHFSKLMPNENLKITF